MPRLPRENLLLYRDQNNRPQPVRTIEEWLLRREEIKRNFESVAGRLPHDEKRCDLAVVIEQEVDFGSYLRRLITYVSEPRGRVPAYLLVPKKALEPNAPKLPAVLALHPTDQKVGHGVVVGLKGTPYPAYANELVERGLVVLAPSYPLLANYQPDLKALGWESGTLKAVWDNMRGLDLLDTTPYVRSGRYAALGHSLGGHNAVFTGVFDQRIAAVISSCGLDSNLDYYGGDEKVWMPEKGWTQTRYIPKLREYRGRLKDIPFDFHELIGTLAPRDVFISAPLHDDNFRSESVDRIVAAARPVYRLYGKEERLHVEHPDCKHEFPPAMRQKAYALIDEVLRA